jgi:hypothetical protein
MRDEHRQRWGIGKPRLLGLLSILEALTDGFDICRENFTQKNF